MKRAERGGAAGEGSMGVQRQLWATGGRPECAWVAGSRIFAVAPDRREHLAVCCCFCCKGPLFHACSVSRDSAAVTVAVAR